MHFPQRFALAGFAAGLAILSAAGGVAFVHTESPALTLATLLAVALALATQGPKAAGKAWGFLFGEDPIYGPETRDYKKATRGRQLAPKLRRFVAKAKEPVTVLAVGVEHHPNRNGLCRWTDALRDAAGRGANVWLLLPQIANEPERAHATALSDEHPQIRCIDLKGSDNGSLDIFFPVLIWSGELAAPSDALFWLEGARDDEFFTDAEFRNGDNLRANPDLLDRFVRSLEAAARCPLPPPPPGNH